MSQTDVEVSNLRDALPASVHECLSDSQLRSGLAQAQERLGSGADKATLQGAAWLLAHDPGQRQEQIAHMLEIATSRHHGLVQAERHLLGAFRAEPELDDTVRDTTRQEFQDDLDRAEKLLAVATARAGGILAVTDQDAAEAPALLVERADQGLRLITFDLDSYLDGHRDL